ncbi:hypothetical protein Mapa_003008 [Marchantia paleacea]|nr:hypothetical protein Mapa_003008 [Marchantia paleacea]
MHILGPTSQVVNLIHLQQNWLDNVVTDEFEARIAKVPLQIFFPASEEIIHNDNAVSSIHQAVHKMTSHETGTSCHNNSQGFPLQAKGNFTTRAPDERVLLNDGKCRSFKIDPVPTTHSIHHCVRVALFSSEHTFRLEHEVA